MINVLFVLTLVVFGLIAQGQTLKDISNNYLGKEICERSKRLETDYGNLTIKFKKKKGVISKVLVTIPNNSDIDIKVYKTRDYQDFRIGSMWTDYSFSFEPFEENIYYDYIDALCYYNKYELSDIESYQDISIFKNKKLKYKKTAYVVTLNKQEYVNKKKLDIDPSRKNIR